MKAIVKDVSGLEKPTQDDAFAHTAPEPYREHDYGVPAWGHGPRNLNVKRA